MTIIQSSAWMRVLEVSSAAVTSRNRHTLETVDHFSNTRSDDAMAVRLVIEISTMKAMISRVSGESGKRFGSRATKQPNMVAAKMIWAQGAVLTNPHASWWGFMKDTHDHIRTPTNGRANAIGIRQENSMRRRSERMRGQAPERQAGTRSAGTWSAGAPAPSVSAPPVT